MKHTIICTQQFGNYWSGLGAYSTAMVKGLVEQGIKVTVVSPGEPIEMKGVTFISVKPSKLDFTHGGWFSLSYAYKKALKGLNADIIHFADARESFAYRGSIPAIGTLHDDYFARHSWNFFHYKHDYIDWLKRWMYYSFVRILEKKALKRLSGLLANSNATTEKIASAYAISKDHIKTVYLGMKLDIHLVNDQIEAKRLMNPTLLLVGGNVQRKGIQTIFKSLKQLIQEYPNISLLVIGKNQNIPKLKFIATKLGIEQHVEFTGWVNPTDIHKYYQDASIFVMPSLMEGFGLVFLEAMSNGLPVIGGHSGGIPELIEDNENGVLVSPRNTNSLTAKISMLLKDQKFRNKIIQNGYNTVGEFSISKMVDKTIQYYEYVLNAE